MKTLLKVQLALCFAGLTALAAEPGAQFFENDQVKVFRALERAHVKAKFHEHKINRVMVYIQDGKQHFDFQDGRPGLDVVWKAGQLEWSKPEGMHQPEVTDDNSFNIIEVELKKPGTAKAAQVSDATKADKKNSKVELDNDQVRILRVKLAPHAKGGKVTRTGNAVVAYISGAKANQAEWVTAGASQLENTGDKAMEAIVVELKN